MKKDEANNIAQKDLIIEFFKRNPNRDIKHPEIVDWVYEEYRKRTGKVFRDPDRAIRQLHQQGILQKIGKGVYRYDPDFIKSREFEDFSSEMKKKIFEKDGYKCVICGFGIKDGVEIHADHIIPKDLGGKAILENGQTLCGKHNYLKKNFKQTETGKKMFIRLYDLAKKQNNQELVKFCSDILETYEKHSINGHIVWER